MGEILTHTFILAFAIPTTVIIIIGIVLLALLLIPVILLGNRRRKRNRSASPGGWYQQERDFQSVYPTQQQSTQDVPPPQYPQAPQSWSLPSEQQRPPSQPQSVGWGAQVSPQWSGAPQGTQVSQDKCPYCGAETRPGENFCLNCGNRLLPATPSPQQTQPVTGEAALPASEEWPRIDQEVELPAPHAGFSAPASGTWAADTNAATVAASVSDAPTGRGDVSAPISDKVEQPGHLILRADNGEVLQDYTLEKLETSMGRAPNSDVLLPKDKLTSRRHATIRYENGNYVLYDERSANGTFVNGQQLEDKTPRTLQDNDRIGIGEQEVIFHAYQSPSSGVDSERMSTVAGTAAAGEVTYRTREDELLTAATGDEFSTRSMNDDNIFPAESVPNSPASLPPPAPSPVSSTPSVPSTPVYSPEQLRFTAFHPKEVTVGTWNTLLVYAHIDPAVEAVSMDAQRFKTELSNVPRKISAPATQLLLRETNITITPECKGVVFNPKRITFKWLEDWHRVNFRFFAKEELVGSAGNGRINIFAGPLLVGTLKLGLLFEEKATPVPDTEVTANLYQQIFASYSHDDSPIVLGCRNVYKALGFKILIDIDTLRSGQLFNDALKRMIDAADIFQLFWSERSAKSVYVTQEWEYALKLNRGEGFVRPVYWEVPMTKPPEKLAPLHFAYLPAYTFAQPSPSRQEPLDSGSTDSPFLR